MSPEEDYFLELLGKHLEGTLSPEERKALLILAETDPDKAFLLTYLSDGPGDKDTQLEAEIIYEKTAPTDLRPKITVLRSPVILDRPRKTYRYVAVAASIICLLGIWWGINRYYLSVDKGEEWEQMVTAKGERKHLKMSDGTEIWLNSESSLKVKSGYGIKHRQMELQGEAYFSVTRNEQLPLLVKAFDTEIEVLGTIFNVRAYPDEKKIATSLIEGKVKLHVDRGNGRKDYALNPGDKVEIPNKHFVKKSLIEPLEKEVHENSIIEDHVDYKKIAVKNDEALEFMWIENKLVFNGDPMEDMIRKMERWYNRTIVVENESLKKESFTGVFQERTCEQVLDLLQKTGVKFSYRVENGIIYIK